jgi:trehalose 6-phosphate phosphatase
MSGPARQVELLTGSIRTTRVSQRRVVRQWHGASHRPRYLFDEWRRVAARLRTARHIVLFLDFDGTLAPLQDDPQRVWLDEATRRLLRRLAHRITVFVISGRRRADVIRRVRVAGVEYLGLYGWEDGTREQKHSQSWRLVHEVRRLIKGRLRHLPGIRIENKGPLFAVHYRGATRDAIRRAKAAVREMLTLQGSDLQLMKSKSAWDVLPENFEGKGTVVEKLVRGFPADTFTIYLGDDVSDEAAFQVLRRGLTVVVGKRSRTSARFYVRDPAEVRQFLTNVEAIIA